MTLQIIKSMLIYYIYNKYYSIIINIYNKDNKELLYLLSCIDKLHSRYSRDLTLAEFSLYVLSTVPDKDKEVYSSLLKELQETDVDNLVLDDIIRDVQRKHHAYELAIASLEVSEGRRDFSDLLVLAQNLNAAESDSESPETLFVTNDLGELHNESIVKQGLRWRLQTLNGSLGSLRKGDFGFIFARPETGKTTFLASEVSNFATQVESPILWLNNEEQGSKVQIRVYQAMLGCTLTELFSNVSENKRRYMELGGDKIKIYDTASIHRGQVEKLVRELQPSLIVIDQIDKIKGFADDREDLRLGAIYIWARELAKQHCPLIGVCQADASGEGKKFLTMENVANAKTAKQAEADWILGIGKSHTEGEYIRYLHLSKNKLTGDEDTDPEQRHGKATVIIRPEIARYVDA